MLYVTHDQGEAARIAHRVALLDGGRILQQGPFKELIAHPISARAAGVLGLGEPSTPHIDPESILKSLVSD